MIDCAQIFVNYENLWVSAPTSEPVFTPTSRELRSRLDDCAHIWETAPPLRPHLGDCAHTTPTYDTIDYAHFYAPLTTVASSAGSCQRGAGGESTRITRTEISRDPVLMKRRQICAATASRVSPGNKSTRQRSSKRLRDSGTLVSAQPRPSSLLLNTVL